MIYAFGNGRIDDRSGFGIKFDRFVVVTGFDKSVELLNSGFNFGFVILINGILLRVYKNTLFSGFNVRHFIFSFDELVFFTVLLFYHKKNGLTRIFNGFLQIILYIFQNFGVWYV